MVWHHYKSMFERWIVDRLFIIDLRLLQCTWAVVLHPVMCGSWAGPALKPNPATCEGCRAAVRGKLAKSLLCLHFLRICSRLPTCRPLPDIAEHQVSTMQ